MHQNNHRHSSTSICKAQTCCITHSNTYLCLESVSIVVLNSAKTHLKKLWPKVEHKLVPISDLK